MNDISIVVPVYNVERYIYQCIESILKQTYSHYQVIIVDDGSTDGSIDIASALVGNDSRFKIVTKSNGGLSSARNFGLEFVKTKYVAFLDSDDFFELDFIEVMLNKIIEEDSDIVVCRTKLVSESGEHIKTVGMNDNLSMTGIDALLANLEMKKFSSAAWNKIYKRSLFDDPNNLYLEGAYYEDRATTHNILYSCNKVVCISNPLINYLQRASSIMHSLSRKKIDDRFLVCDKLYHDMVRMGLIPKYKSLYERCFIIVTLIGGAKQIAKYSDSYIEDISYLKEQYNKYRPSKAGMLTLSIRSPRFFLYAILILRCPNLYRYLLRR